MRPAQLGALVAGVAVIFHATWTAELEISKQLATVAALGGAIAWTARTRRAERPGQTWALAVVALVLLVPLAGPGRDFLAQRVESWAHWLLIGLVVWLVARDAAPRVHTILAAVGGALGAIGLAQAAGADWFIAGVGAFAGQRVMGTLGNPALCGACLALLLPFLVTKGGRTPFLALGVVAIAALVLTGSRAAWVMALPALWPAAVALTRRRLAILGALGLALGLGVGGLSDAVNLTDRVGDLSDDRGTAAGRVYIWSIVPRMALQAGPVGGGPGAFRRAWPLAQGEYLAAHPDDASFHSDLLHAHVDLAEIAVDWGWLGLALFLIATARVLRRPARGSPDRLAAKAVVVSALVGGLAFPVLHFLTSAAVFAVATGVLLSPLTESEAEVTVRRAQPLLAISVLAAALIWMIPHARSEYWLTEGLKQSAEGHAVESAEAWCRAAEIDASNPMALALCSRTLHESDPARSLALARAAVELLPSAATHANLADAARAAGELEEVEQALRRAEFLVTGR